MADPDIFRIKGTCYEGPEEEAGGAMLPCGNEDLFGPLACCQQGDMCLSNNACYNGEHGVTYLAGCSDPSYEHESCPDKGAWEDDPWVGLVYCGDDSRQWIACGQEEAPDTLAKPDDCSCPKTSRTVAFTADSVLDNIASLPPSSSGNIIWINPPIDLTSVPSILPETTPTTTTTTAASSLSASPTSINPDSSLTTPSRPTGSTEPTPIEDANTDSGSGLNNAAIIGIGVGVGAGATILLVILVMLFFAFKKRRQAKEEEVMERIAQASSSRPGDPGPFDQAASPNSFLAPTAGISEIDSQAARPWSMRSELEGTPVTPLPDISKSDLFARSFGKEPEQDGSQSQSRAEDNGRVASAQPPIMELPG